MEIKTLYTERLILEPQTVDHAEKLFVGFSDVSLSPYSIRSPLKSVDQLRTGIASLQNRISSDGKEYCLNWVLVSKNNNDYIGQIEISLPIDEKIFNLAYTVFKKHQKNGYAKEACKEVLRYMKEDLKATTASLWMDVRNIASIKLAESLGAEKIERKDKSQQLATGEWSDEFVYKLEL